MFKVGNVELSQVPIVGLTRQAENVLVNIVYRTEDMTAAPLAVPQGVDTDDASSENTVVPPETRGSGGPRPESFSEQRTWQPLKPCPAGHQ